MYLGVNNQLGPPYHVLLDTSFINQCIRNKLDVVDGCIDCLHGAVVPYITDCVLSEIEKHARRFRLAPRVAKDPRVRRLRCLHKDNVGYGDDCLVNRVKIARIYIVATCDHELRQRLRKVPGVPIMYVRNRRIVVERMPLY